MKIKLNPVSRLVCRLQPM